MFVPLTATLMSSSLTTIATIGPLFRWMKITPAITPKTARPKASTLQGIQPPSLHGWVNCRSGPSRAAPPVAVAGELFLHLERAMVARLDRQELVGFLRAVARSLKRTASSISQIKKAISSALARAFSRTAARPAFRFSSGIRSMIWITWS